MLIVVFITLFLTISGVKGLQLKEGYRVDNQTEKLLTHATKLIAKCQEVESEITRQSSVINGEWNTIQTVVGEIYKQLSHNQSIVESTTKLVQHVDTLKQVLLHKDSNSNKKKNDIDPKDRRQVAQLIGESIQLNEAAQLMLSHHNSVQLYLNNLKLGLCQVVDMLRRNVPDPDLFDIYRHVLIENSNLVQSAIPYIIHAN